MDVVDENLFLCFLGDFCILENKVDVTNGNPNDTIVENENDVTNGNQNDAIVEDKVDVTNGNQNDVIVEQWMEECCFCSWV